MLFMWLKAGQQSHPEIKWCTREIVFSDRWAAIDWMCKNQLGRRNLTEEQRTYLIGKQYEARKHTERFKGNQYTSESGVGQNDPNQRISETIAAEQNVAEATVRRAEKYATGVDIIRERDPETADAVLRGQTEANNEEAPPAGGAFFIAQA